MSPEDVAALLRWRLALGPAAERAMPETALERLGATEHDVELDRVLQFVYGEGEQGGKRAARAYLPQWLGALRGFFRHDVIAMIQEDAIARRDLTELLFEPETLPFLERNIELVSTILAARSLVPDRAKELARRIVGEVVEGLRAKLATTARAAILGAVRRDQHAPLRSLRNVDWHRTIRGNLRGWDPQKRRLIAERLYFWKNQRRRHEWDVTLVVDQSGSMAESVVYAAVIGAIFASLDVMRTRMILFDEEIVDVTPLLGDPVELLFASQLGGGTDIDRAVAYARQHLIERPERTLFVLVSDLYENGDRASLVARMRELVESKVKCLAVLALTDGGRAAYDHEIATALTAVGVPCLACTPRLLIDQVAKLMR